MSSEISGYTPRRGSGEKKNNESFQLHYMKYLIRSLQIINIKTLFKLTRVNCLTYELHAVIVLILTPGAMTKF